MEILPQFYFKNPPVPAGFWTKLGMLLLLGLLLEAYWRIYRGRLRRYWKNRKPKKPRVRRPKSPRDCGACCAGEQLAFFRPRTDVEAYRATKSRRGRKKRIRTEGHACPNEKCKYYCVLSEDLHALVGDGKRGKEKDIQYFKCQACEKRFTCRLHTPLYRLKTEPGRISLVLLVLAEGCDLSVVARWLARAGTHSRQMHNQVLVGLQVAVLQLDELYPRVRREGVRWLWVALDPDTKLIPALRLGSRKTEEGMGLVHEVWQRLAPGCQPAFLSDGLGAYFYALTAHFGRWWLPERARKPHWAVAEDLLHGQVLKRKRGRKLEIETRMGWGKLADLHAVLKAQGLRGVIQTAFIERVNLTIRRGVAPLMRKTWAYAQTERHLALHVEWWRAYYHFVRPHRSLTKRVPGLGHKQA